MVFQVIGIEPLDEKIDVRLSDEEKARLQEDADLAGVSMSALVRAEYFKRPVVATTDQVMIRQLRGLGLLLKAAHVKSNGAYSNETAAALMRLSEAIKALGEKALGLGKR